MSDYTRFFLSSARSVVQLECLEISHPSFSKTYRIVRNHVDGVQVIHEDSVARLYDYFPCRIRKDGVTNDMDSTLAIDLGDLGELVASEWDLALAAGTNTTKPSLKFRVYRSDDLTEPLYGPYVYEIVGFSFTREGTTFVAQAPRINMTGTGETYTLERFPGLRGFL